MARPRPSLRAQTRKQNRENFQREEDLARLSEEKLGKPLVLGERDTKSGKGRNRIVQARLFGPAVRGVEPTEGGNPKKKKKAPLY